jgi:PhnB protein
MATRLNPYISFPGTAREAMQHYEQVFGGSLSLSTFGEYGAEGEGADGIMHAMLEAPGGLTLMASDMPPGMEHQPGNGMAISLSGDDADVLRGWWERLAEGGTVTMPLERQMWGDEFGMVTDRFGVAWMVNIGPAAA